METKNLKAKHFALKPFIDAQGIAVLGGSDVSGGSAGMVYGHGARTGITAGSASGHWTRPVIAETPRPKGAVGRVSTEHPAAT